MSEPKKPKKKERVLVDQVEEQPLSFKELDDCLKSDEYDIETIIEHLILLKQK